MQCFAHSSEAAVGVCKSCGKGVCKSCAIEVDRGIACSEQCKPLALALSRLQLTAIRNIGLASSQRFVQPLMAVVFLGAALFLSLRYGTEFYVWFLYAMGGVLAFISVLSWLKQAGKVPTSNGP